MNTGKPMWVIGLMSGTSLDGIDAALIETDGVHVAQFGEWLTLPYDDDEKNKLRAAVRGEGDMLLLEHELTLKHAKAVKMLLKQAGKIEKDIRVIGFHGQTIVHRPSEGITCQIGNGALLAELTGIDVVNDFRRRDVAAGGQGAPLVPLYQAAITLGQELPVAIVNLGGVANVTWIGHGVNALLAFDTGPGNALINDWVYKKTGRDYDDNGKLASAGQPNEVLLEILKNDVFFATKPPKSLDRNHFAHYFGEDFVHSTLEDGAATLTEFTAVSIAKAAQYFPQPAKSWLICGGGRHNPALMKALARHLPQVISVDTLGWQGDALEAQAFGFLAMRALKGMPLTLPGTTGVKHAITGGALHHAHNSL